jgi:hypothetical protein
MITESYRGSLRSIQKYASFVHLDHQEDLPILYPPVFLPDGMESFVLDYGTVAPANVSKVTVAVRDTEEVREDAAPPFPHDVCDVKGPEMGDQSLHEEANKKRTMSSIRNRSDASPVIAERKKLVRMRTQTAKRRRGGSERRRRRGP